MAFCTKCGHEVAEDAAFCGACGTKRRTHASSENVAGASPSPRSHAAPEAPPLSKSRQPERSTASAGNHSTVASRFSGTFWLFYLSVLGWVGLLALGAVSKGPASYGLKAIGIALLAGLIAPVVWLIADGLRKAAMPDMFLARGMIDTLQKRLFWAIGPQVIGLALLCWFSTHLILSLDPNRASKAGTVPASSSTTTPSSSRADSALGSNAAPRAPAPTAAEERPGYASGDSDSGVASGKADLAELPGGQTNARSLDPDVLQSFLPDRLAGMRQTYIDAVRNAVRGVEVSIATARYGGSNGLIEVEIVDMAGASSILAEMDEIAFESENETDVQIEKTYQQDRDWVQETWQKDGSKSQLQRSIGYRYMVKLSGTSVGIDTLKRAFEELELDELESSSRVATTAAVSAGFCSTEEAMSDKGCDITLGDEWSPLICKSSDSIEDLRFLSYPLNGTVEVLALRNPGDTGPVLLVDQAGRAWNVPFSPQCVKFRSGTTRQLALWMRVRKTLLETARVSAGPAPYSFVARINDPDGFTNIRESPSSQAPRIARVFEGERFHTYPQESEWWEVRTVRGTVGFMPRDRIQILDSWN